MSAGPPALRRLVLWAPVALLLAYEFYLSSQSVLPDVPMPFGVGDWEHRDKLEHAAYFFLTGLFAIRAAGAEGWARRRTALAVLLGTLLWGASDELHQSFVPNRSVEAGDVAADVSGAALALLAASFLDRLVFDRPHRDP